VSLSVKPKKDRSNLDFCGARDALEPLEVRRPGYDAKIFFRKGPPILPEARRDQAPAKA